MFRKVHPPELLRTQELGALAWLLRLCLTFMDRPVETVQPFHCSKTVVREALLLTWAELSPPSWLVPKALGGNHWHELLPPFLLSHWMSRTLSYLSLWTPDLQQQGTPLPSPFPSL